MASAGYESFFYTGAADAAAAAITTKVAEVVNISGPNIEGEDIDVTSMDSTSGFREFIAGLVDGGEVSIDLVFGKAELALLYSYIRDHNAYKVAFSDGSTWHFNGYLKSIGNEAPHEDKISCTATIKVQNQPTFTAAV